MSDFKKNIWMYGIIATFIVFASLMIYFASIATHFKSDLVITDYYKAELQYQKQINKLDNTAALASKPLIKYDSLGHKVYLTLAHIGVKDSVGGSLYFYRPDDSKSDFTVKIKINNEGIQVIDGINHKYGRYIVKMDWRENGKGYYLEKAVML